MSVAFSGNENEVDVESLRTRLSRMKGRGACSIYPSGRVHVFAACEFRETAAPGVRDSVKRG